MGVLAQKPLLFSLGLGGLLCGGSVLVSLLAMLVLTETLPPKTLFYLLCLGILLLLSYPWEQMLSAPQDPFADNVLGDYLLLAPGFPCLLWTLAVFSQWLCAVYQLIRYGDPQLHEYQPLFPEASAPHGSRAMVQARGQAGEPTRERRRRKFFGTLLVALLLCVPGEQGARLRDRARSSGGDLFRGAMSGQRLAKNVMIGSVVLTVVLWCVGALGQRFMQGEWRSQLQRGTGVVKQYYATHHRLPETLAEALNDLPATEHNRLRITRVDGEGVYIGDAWFQYLQTSDRTFRLWISRGERGSSVQQTGPWCEFHVRGTRSRCGWVRRDNRTGGA